MDSNRQGPSDRYKNRSNDETSESLDSTVGSNSLSISIKRDMTLAFSNQRVRAWLTGMGMAVLVSIVVYCVDRSLMHSTRRNTEVLVQTILDQQVESLDMWLEAEFRFLQSWSRSEELVAEVLKIDAVARTPNVDFRQISAAGNALREMMRGVAGTYSSFRYAVWNREYREIASTEIDSTALGSGSTDFGDRLLSRVLKGENVLWLQSSKGYITRGYQPGPAGSTKPDLALLVPVYEKIDQGENASPIAVLLIAGFGMQDRFERMTTNYRFRDNGEIYAIDEDGFMITESRFKNHLQSSGLIPPGIDPISARLIRVATPGVNTYRTKLEPSIDKSEWPLTQAARSVIHRQDGNNFDGYEDYRGVQVVGAWAWLDKYDFGIITELDYDSAFEAMFPLRLTYGVLLGLGGVIGIASFVNGIAAARSMRKDSIESEIGPYLIERKIGEGGLAVVYLAHHAMLKRPTAIKQLKANKLTQKNLLRFEREVQLASKLKHPNSIEIYDYGRTPKGNFYCAMEFIDGITLHTLLEIDGPQPPERVTYLLTEICRSLREAHALGMIHRDIKPQNIMISKRARVYDCIKVLDFGLARELDPDSSHATETRMLVGTPMYIAPERIFDPACLDPRSDIFSLGVLAYVLLTGKEPHKGKGGLSVLAETMSSQPMRPSQAIDSPIPEALDEIVVRCQARKADDRIQSVQELLELLHKIDFIAVWNEERARDWWDSYSSRFQEP